MDLGGFLIPKIMAEGKKSVIVYADWIGQFEQLTDEEAGKLIKHFFDFINDKNPELEDRFLKMAFYPIEQSLKRDLLKWRNIREKRQLAGKISAQKRNQQVLTNSTHVKSVEQSSTNSTVSVNVNDNVNVNVNDNINLNINNKLMSEIKISDDILFFKNQEIKISKNEIYYFQVAEKFRKLFIRNLKESNAPINHQEKATFKNYVEPIRLMVERDKVTKEQFRRSYDFLNSADGDFWKKNILSTAKLREQIQKLLINANTKRNEPKTVTFNKNRD